MLSLCMIVKDEYENLNICLSKLAPLVDEIIIVDTGSTDKTKTIVSKFTNKFYDYNWCNDFSKARNFSISKAFYDWILVLDADEFITDFSKDNVNKFISSDLNIDRVGRIQRINGTENSKDNKKYFERVNRLFNKNYFHYEGLIHEQIVSLDGKYYETELVDITAEHVGYTKQS